MAGETVGLSDADGEFCLNARNDESDRDQVYRQGSFCMFISTATRCQLVFA
jgi:hypothetical protein